MISAKGIIQGLPINRLSYALVRQPFINNVECPHEYPLRGIFVLKKEYHLYRGWYWILRGNRGKDIHTVRNLVFVFVLFVLASFVCPTSFEWDVP